MSSALTGKLAFVTGAGGGIGRAICRLLAREGAKVIAADANLKNAEDIINSIGSPHFPLQVDVGNSASVHSAFKTAIDHFSDVPTVLVNAAGITRDNFLLKLTDEDFDAVLNVNLKGTFLVTKIGVNSMIEGKISHGGSIINVSSIIGKVGNIGQSNYSASKAGVVAFTKSAAMEFGKFGVRVNAILPGLIDTPIIKTVPEDVLKMFVKRIPLERIGKPEEIAELVVFLASNKSSYINGAAIEITGGLY